MKHSIRIFGLVLTMFLGASSALAGNEGAHGGDGLYIGNKLYVLDLVEAGVQADPFFHAQVKTDPVIAKRLVDKFDPRRYPVALLAKKLSDVGAIDRAFAYLILGCIEAYEWRLVDSALVDINDEASPLYYPKKRLVQLAARSKTTIRIDQALWKKLDAKNKVALILHEAIYAMTKPQPVYEGSSIHSQFSQGAREVTGFLFTPESAKKSHLDFSWLVYREIGLTMGREGDRVRESRGAGVKIYVTPKYWMDIDTDYSSKTFGFSDHPELWAAPLGSEDNRENVGNYCLLHLHAGKTTSILYAIEHSFYGSLEVYATQDGERTYFSVIDSEMEGIPFHDLWRVEPYQNEQECVENVHSAIDRAYRELIAEYH